jgi:hypothetical protein
MGIFSLNWFKSQKQKQLEDLQVELEIERTKSYLDSYKNPTPVETQCQEVPDNNWTVTSSSQYYQDLPNIKPYMNIKMVNDTLTIILLDGSILTKSDATAEHFNAARDCRTEYCLMNIVSSPEMVKDREKKEAEFVKAKAIQTGAEFLAKFDDFEMKDGSLYLKGINRSLPGLMVEEFLEIIGNYSYAGQANIDEMNAMVEEDDEYQGLKRFFMWCCLNPRAEVADKLFVFLKKNSFKITKQGFFVALRNVVTLHGSTELVHFISNAYNKVKAVWKKKPDDYFVFLENGEYKMVHKDAIYKEETVECSNCDGSGYIADYDSEDSEECCECGNTGEVTEGICQEHGENLGNLTELYLDLPNRAENRFTDAHTRTFDIRIGRPVNMPMDKCRWNTDDCGAEGLHFTSDEIHYVGCGDTSVIVLINPMKVVGIGESKGRCYEYLPIMTVAREEATEILHDLEFDTLELDESYAVRELEDLATKARDGFIAENKKYDFNLPALSAAEMYNIVRSLDEMKYEISKRIVILD